VKRCPQCNRVELMMRSHFVVRMARHWLVIHVT
jgi:hypothetical protein